MPTLAYRPSDEREDSMEDMMREWLSYIHMDPADADCFVNEVRASSYWQTDPPSLELPPAEGDRLADECEIDLTTLYTISNGD
jgi:hypothetical protein